MNKTHPTPYPDLNHVLQEFVNSVQEILKNNLVGIYLQGSFAAGDFDRHSDVDWLIVIEEELSDETVAALQEMHGRLYDMEQHWAQHLEGSYFPRETLRDNSKCGTDLWFLDNGSQKLKRSDHCNTIVVRWTVREHGLPLTGPPPETLIDPITAETLKGEIYVTINEWGEEILNDSDRFNNNFYQVFIVLSYCRMLHSLDEGFIGSKLDGAEWAKANLDPKWTGLIDQCLASRPDPERTVFHRADPAEFALTLEFLRYAMGESGRFFDV